MQGGENHTEMELGADVCSGRIYWQHGLKCFGQGRCFLFSVLKQELENFSKGWISLSDSFDGPEVNISPYQCQETLCSRAVRDGIEACGGATSTPFPCLNYMGFGATNLFPKPSSLSATSLCWTNSCVSGPS